MNEYIIRNCNVLYFNPDKTAICNDLNLEYPCECKERADCVMKKIFATCKQEIKVNNDDAPTNAYAMGRVVVAEKILELLDIDEVE